MIGPNELPDDFDAEAYFDINPDIATAGIGAVTHYLTVGRSEGRSYRRQGSSSTTRDTNPLYNNEPIIDRISLVLFDYQGGSYDSVDDAAAAILDAIRTPTRTMCEMGDKLSKGGDPTSYVWHNIIDHARLEAYQEGKIVSDKVESLIRRMSPAPICDDCISDTLSLSLRHHADIKTHELAGAGGFRRGKDTCSRCTNVKMVIRHA